MKNQYKNLQKPSQLAYHLDTPIKAFPASYNIIDTPAMGAVKITKHAIDRLVERTTAGQPKNPWLSLTRMIKNPELEKKKLTPDIIEKKRRKYGNRLINEIWGHPGGCNEFIIATDKQKRTLVSFYDASMRD